MYKQGRRTQKTALGGLEPLELREEPCSGPIQLLEEEKN